MFCLLSIRFSASAVARLPGFRAFWSSKRDDVLWRFVCAFASFSQSCVAGKEEVPRKFLFF